jgi:MoxR-like ATPase
MQDNTEMTVRLTSIIMQLGLHGGKNQAFMLQGPPGVGKTMGIYALAESLEKKLGHEFPAEIWSGPQIQAEDASGLPVPDLESGTTRLLPLRLGAKVQSAPAGVLCIDEFGSLTADKEAAFLNLIQGGILGEKKLPNTLALGAMMNPDDIASNGRALTAPAANRFVWLDWALDSNVWVDYMQGGKGLGTSVQVLPKDWEQQYGTQARGLIASYIKRFPSNLLQEPKPHDASKPWPSPRSWEAAARLMAACMALDERKESDIVHAAVQGCVGDGQAQAFMQWLIDSELPDPEDLLKDPDNAHKLFPKRNDQLMTTMESLATVAGKESENKVERWETAWRILGPVFLEKNDVGLPGAHILAKNKPNGASYPPECQKVSEILQKAGFSV